MADPRPLVWWRAWSYLGWFYYQCSPQGDLWCVAVSRMVQANIPFTGIPVEADCHHIPSSVLASLPPGSAIRAVATIPHIESAFDYEGSFEGLREEPSWAISIYHSILQVRSNPQRPAYGKDLCSECGACRLSHFDDGRCAPMFGTSFALLDREDSLWARAVKAHREEQDT